MVLRYTPTAAVGECYLHTNARQLCEANKTVMLNKTEEKASNLRETKNNHYYVLVSTTHKFSWNGPDTTIVAGTPMDPTLHLGRVLRLDARLKAGPLYGQRVAITVFAGAVAVVPASPVQVCDSKCVHDLVANAHHTFFDVDQALLLLPGDCLLVPVAYYPIVVSLATDKETGMLKIPGAKESKVHNPTDFSSWSVSAPFDASLDLKHSSESTSFALRTYNASSSDVPLAIRSSSEVGSWKDLLNARPKDTES